MTMTEVTETNASTQESLSGNSMSESTEMPEFLAVDFYCGAGGTTRGLLDAGGYVICGIDKDESNRVTFQSNNRNTTLDEGEPDFLALDMFPSGPDYPGGQQEQVWAELRELIPHYRTIAPGVPLLFVICAPCQSFTSIHPTSDNSRPSRKSGS